MPRIRVTVELDVPYGLVEQQASGDDEAIAELEERVLEEIRDHGLGPVEFVED